MSRSGKTKIVPVVGSELYALGSKSGNSSDSKAGTSKSTSSKRDSGSSTNLAAAKKAKLTSPSPALSRSGSMAMESWEQELVECEAAELVSAVLTATDQQDSDKIIGLICGAIKSSTNKTKMDQMLYMQLLYLGKLRPHIFCNDTVTQALISVLKRDSTNTFKAKSNPIGHVLTCNLLARGYYDKKQWPEIFLRIYIDDAINERIWVDNEDCAIFVENIVLAFGTKIPPKSLLQPELNALTPIKDMNADDESMDSLPSRESSRSAESAEPTTSKYAAIQSTVEKLVVEAIKEQLNRRQGPDGTTRNFLKFLSTVTGLSEVRCLIVTRLELWIHNGKLNKPAQELLTYLCFNITAQNPKDQEVLSSLVKIRLKTKPLINIFLTCFKEMINIQPEILGTSMKYVVQNELSNSRNPNNMGMLANMFQTKPEISQTQLAEIYQEFLLQKEDCLRSLKVFLREIIKMLRYDINLTVFVKAFVNIRLELVGQIQNSEFRERIFSSIIDLICLCMFLSVSPQIRDLIMAMRNGRDVKDSPILYNYFAQMCQMQCDVLTFMLEVAPNVFKPNPNEYAALLHKVLLFDTPESYSKAESWPQDSERAFLIRATSEIPLHQDSILKLILIGIHKEIHFSIPDSMEIIEQLVRRAGCLKTGTTYPPLEANKLEIINFLFSMSEYHHPDNIQLPINYEPPKLAISSLYWKTWTILLVLSAHNTGTFGAVCWEQHPMLRNLIEMCITNQFMQAKPPEEELQIATIEKSRILEFEGHLAAATSKAVITEQTSLLLSQVMLMDPLGVARRPPNHVLEQLQNLNKTHKLGHLLCRSRKPDLLVDIIQRQGTSQSMPWLADLVQNSEGDFNHLPVQCLCEFLLSNPVHGTNTREQELMIYLQNIVLGEQAEPQTSGEVIEYFLRRLSSTSRVSRQYAICALELLLKVLEKEDEPELSDSEWLQRFLPMIPHFPFIRPNIIIQLRAACQVENNAEHIMAYIQFIAAHTLQDGLPEMFETVLDMSQLIVERSTVFSQIIPDPTNETNESKYNTLNYLFVMFNNFLVKLRENKAHVFEEYPDLILIHFVDGTTCSIHLSIVQAFVILLTHTPMIQGAEIILDYWFPLNAAPPQATNQETTEAVQILPDWLKLKMIRSNVDRLVDAALQELTPDQIVLFVQNFGTSVNSMSKLLALLDRAVIEQCETVNAAILNKPYLAQLIEIQQSRGAKNGHISVQALDLHDTTVCESPKAKQPVVDEWILSLKKGMQVKESKHQSLSKTNKEFDDIMEAILARSTPTRTLQVKTRKFIQQLTAQIGTNRPEESEVFNKVIQYFLKLMKTQQGPFLFRNISQNSTTCSFFRTLFSVKADRNDLQNAQSQVVEELLKYINPTQHPVLVQILLNKRKIFVKPKIPQQSVSQAERKHALAQVLQSPQLSKVEFSGKKLLQEINKASEDSSSLVRSLSSTLRVTDSPLDGEKQGLLIDWLAEADSEMIRSNEELQLELLFNRSKRSFRPYLLSLLSHQSSWTTMARVIEKLLSKYNSDLDPSCVLDFVEALIRNPKLWQGRDRAIPKHEQSEYILQLSEEEVRAMVQYILNESELAGPKDSIHCSRLSMRIHLLLHATDPKQIDLMKLINFVEHYEGGLDIKPFDSNHKLLNKQFLRHLYLNLPPMKFFAPDLKEIYDANLRPLSGCVADKLLHFVITTISSLSNPKDWQQMFSDMELIIRKITACHPALMLRQISVLAGLLQGRAHMDLYVLRQEHHLQLFHQVIGLLELLQPMIFEDCYQDALHSALDCFFTFLRNHGNTKESYPILYRLIDLLQAYTSANASRALVFIERYADILHELAATNRNIIGLQQILQGLSLLKHKTTAVPSTSKTEVTGEDGGEGSHGSTAVILAPYNRGDNTPPHWHKLVLAFKKNNVDDVATTLDEIDNITYKKSALLEDVFDKILEFLSHSVASVRTVSHRLIVRYLKQNPGNPVNNFLIVTSYIQCLNSNDTFVVLSALDVLTEVVLCLQEHAGEILKAVFDIGVSSKANVFNPLRKCILTLKMQHGC